MGLETGTFISDLVETNPVGSVDPKSQGDDHIRLIKATIRTTFPNINGAVNATPAQLNHLVGVTAGIQGQLDAKADAAATSSALALKANAADVVNLAGSQTITGGKNFTAAQQFSTIELGHASDTTLSRIAAGRVAIEGGEIAKLNASEPFTSTLYVANSQLSTILFGRTGQAANEGFLRFESQSSFNALRAVTDTNTTGQYAFVIRRSGSNVPRVELYASDRDVLRTQADNVAPATTGGLVRHSDATLYDIGMNVMPPLTIAAAIEFARTHVGKTLVKDEATARTWSTPDSSDTNIPLGSTINLMNLGTNAITVAAGSGVTLSRINGTGAAATGSRTLAQGGIATLWKRSATSWVIWGNLGLN